MKKPDVVFFWSEGFLSPWYRCSFKIDGVEYSCVEQYMMSEKARFFNDDKTLSQVLSTTNPAQIKQLGRQVDPFDSHAWNQVKNEVVKKGNRAKFEQNKGLFQQLINTGDAILAEASPEDRYWGIGLDQVTAQRTPSDNWPGLNMQGKIIMEVREILKQVQL